jgi:hypothetical protein
MNVITKKDFLSISLKRGIFTFLNDESCKLCEKYMKEIANFKFSPFYHLLQVILLRDGDKHWMFTENQVVSTPCTRIYVDNNYVFQKYGLLFDTQINEFESKIREWNL